MVYYLISMWRLLPTNHSNTATNSDVVGTPGGQEDLSGECEHSVAFVGIVLL